MTGSTPSSLKSRIYRVFNPRLGQLEAELRVERERITLLEVQVLELRRDSLRIAELTDVLETRLEPQSRIHATGI